MDKKEKAFRDFAKELFSDSGMNTEAGSPEVKKILEKVLPKNG